MSRLLLLVQRPPHLSGEEAETWLRRELGAVAAGPASGRVSLSRLENVSERLTRGYDWLIELECEAAENAVGTTNDGAFIDLYGDLRLIGMSPTAAFANHPVDVTPDELD